MRIQELFVVFADMGHRRDVTLGCHAKTLDGDERAWELRIKRLVLSVPWCV